MTAIRSRRAGGAGRPGPSRLKIERSLRAYLRRRKASERYASFDYCFNYFQSHREEGRLPDLLRGDALQVSCLHLGFYLASWGMFRGGAPLGQKSVKQFVPLIEVIAHSTPAIWEMDAHLYGDGHCSVVFKARDAIRAALKLPKRASDTLVTKIMLGTFGCVPAFDRYFRDGFGAATFGPKALRRIGDFYDENRLLIEQGRVKTLSFASGKATRRKYTRAKVIDMIFFKAGQRQE